MKSVDRPNEASMCQPEWWYSTLLTFCKLLYIPEIVECNGEGECLSGTSSAVFVFVVFVPERLNEKKVNRPPLRHARHYPPIPAPAPAPQQTFSHVRKQSQINFHTQSTVFNSSN